LMIGVKTMEPFQFAFDSIGEAGSPRASAFSQNKIFMSPSIHRRS
jgi:hypothetical protein